MAIALIGLVTVSTAALLVAVLIVNTLDILRAR